jgi:D-alanyl-D-alanine carboxypeptidase
MAHARLSLVLALLLVASPTLVPSTARADAIDDYLKTEMEKRRIPGLALAVVRDGAVVKLQGYGFANLEHDVPVTPDTVFELASVTKQFTATAIMKLVEAGKLQVDDPILWHLPRGPETWKGITVRHLLTHTSGLPGLAEGFKALRSGGERLNYSAAQLFEAATKDALGFAPGERWEYSDVGYFLLGMIIEHASGERYRDVVEARFFRPLGMTSTSVIDQWKVVKHRAAGYTLREGELVNIRRVWQIDVPSHYGVLSTVKDLVTWDGALAAGRVLAASSLAQMWTPVRRTDASTYPYGFGWFVDERRGHQWIAHAGITGTEYSRFPDDRLTVIVLTNLGNRGVGGRGVNAWGLTYGVAGRYLPGLHVGPSSAEPDPDPTMTRRLRETLDRLARGEDPADVNPRVRRGVNRELLAERLRGVSAFTFVACDGAPTRMVERHGDRVNRVCHYRVVNAAETRYYSFWLTSDGRVADVWSSTE